MQASVMADVRSRGADGVRRGGKAHPLGPLVYRAAARHPLSARVTALLVLGAAGSVLGVAAWLHPDVAGVGTHRQLGLAPCSFIALTGYPCPTCGMTTAFAHTVRGQWFSAVWAQPAGFVLALATAATAVAALTVVVTGRVWAVNWYRVRPGRVAVVVLACFLAAWGFKVWMTVGGRM